MRTKGGDFIFNGLVIPSSRPLHPLVAEYLTRKGCKLSHEGEYFVINGNYTLPNRKVLFAELVQLSKELYVDANFDLDVKTNSWNMREFEVVNKNTNREPKVTSIKLEGYDQDIVDLLFIAYLLVKNSVVYLAANREICYLAGDEPLTNDKLIAEASKFIKKEIASMKIQQTTALELNTSDSDSNFDINKINPEFQDLLHFKYFLNQNCQIALTGEGTVFIGGNVPRNVETLEQRIEEFQLQEFARLQAKGLSLAAKTEAQHNTSVEAPVVAPAPAAPAPAGLFAAFSNWIWGSNTQTTETKINDTPKPTFAP